MGARSGHRAGTRCDIEQAAYEYRVIATASV